jgi:actin-like ATPase involved in cell morphogenesis
MAKGLDVGTMNIIAAERQGEKTTLTQQRNLFVEIEYSDVAEKMLARSDVLYIKKDNQVFIVGEDALNFANIFNTTTRRPMQRGILSRDEKSAIPMLRLIIERLVGNPRQSGELIYFTSPARPVDASHDVLYHQKTIESMLRKLDYTPRVLNEGMAVVYSELADNQFTGLGLSFGAGMTNLCLAHYGVPVLTQAVARGGDWIDQQVAEATGYTKDKVTAIKEREFEINPDNAGGEVQTALTIYYDSLTDYVVRTLQKEVTKARVEEGLTIPVAITGGTSAPKGFKELLETKLYAANLPFEISKVKMARSPLYSVAMGTLVAARAEEAESIEELVTEKAR